MDNAKAERILELTEPYDYTVLHGSWKRLCSDRHPDSRADADANQETVDSDLKDINEAFDALKPLVEDGGTIVPSASGGPANASVPDINPSSAAREIYAAAVASMESAETAVKLDVIRGLFLSLGDYADAAEKAEECAKRASLLKSEEHNGDDAHTEDANDSNWTVFGHNMLPITIVFLAACLVFIVYLGKVLL